MDILPKHVHSFTANFGTEENNKKKKGEGGSKNTMWSQLASLRATGLSLVPQTFPLAQVLMSNEKLQQKVFNGSLGDN